MEQQERPIIGQETSMSQPIQFDENMLKFQLENETVLEDIEHNLRREKYNMKTKMWERQKGVEPMLTEEGIYTLLSLARPHMDKNIALSTFTEQQIYTIMEQLEVDVIWGIKNNWKEWGVTRGYADFIVDIIIHPIFGSMKRAQEAATLNMFSNTQSYQQRYVEGDKKKSWWNFSG